MAERLLSMEEACRELQLSKEQLLHLVKIGALRGFRDQQTYKFRPADVEAYKRAAESDITQPQMAGTDKHDTSKIDLAEIEAEPGADESDQTSVLAPADQEGKEEPAGEEKPEFQFSEDVGLEEEPRAEEADQTSLMPPAAQEGAQPAEEEAKFAFAEKGEDLGLEEDAGDSVLVADESESSVDILQVEDETSSEQASSGEELALMEESSSGEEVAAVTEAEEPAGTAATDESSSTETVSDILGEAEEGSDEVLETLDLEEAPDTILEEPPAAKPAEAARPPTAETVPLADEVETAGIVEEEEAIALAEEAEAVPLEEGVEEEAAARPAAIPTQERRIPTWETVVPSKLGNAFLAAAILMLAAGGVFLVCEMAGIQNGFTQMIVDFVKTHIPS